MTTFPCFIFGVLGNVVSFMVYLAPLPTFYRIYNKKSTEGFQSVPYMVSLFSSMLWMYYALIKTHAPLLISINGFGCFIQTIYIAIYMRYAPRKARILTVKMLLLFNLGVFSLLFLLTFLLWKGSNRVHILGWVCVAFSVAVFAAPLSIMKLVITTKSVEFMPLSLSFFLTLSAIMWFLHGLLQNDKYIAIPNVVGFFLGLLQILLYGIYRDTNEVKETEKQLPEPIGFGLGLLQMLLNGIYRDTKEIKEMEKLPERIVDVIRVRAMGSADVHLVDIQPNHDQMKIGVDQKVDEQTSKSEKSMGAQTEIQQNELEV